MTSSTECAFYDPSGHPCRGEVQTVRDWDGCWHLRCELHSPTCSICETRVADVRTGYCDLHEGWEVCSECGLPGDPEGGDIQYHHSIREHLCSSCLDDQYVECDRCDDLIRRQRGVSLCDDCSYAVDDDWDEDDGDDDSANDRGRLFAHDYEPSWSKYGSGDTRFGIELEMEVGDNCSDHVSNGIDLVRQYLGGFAICKYDGSLSNGMEVVTHPATLDYLRTSNLSDLMNTLRSRGWRSWTTGRAGLHVHVSRTAFRDPVHLFVFTLFMYRNSDLFAKYSGRTEDALSRWATFAEHTGRPYEYVDSLYDKVKRGCTGDKYSAVNFQHHQSIEVRIFRGSLNPDTLFGAVELLGALVEYTRNIRAAEFIRGDINWNTFVEYCRQSPDTATFLRVVDVRKVGV